jgi:hypothetical protein
LRRYFVPVPSKIVQLRLKSFVLGFTGDPIPLSRELAVLFCGCHDPSSPNPSGKVSLNLGLL